MSGFYLFLGLTLSGSLLAAETGPGPDGAKIYHDYCSVCHGDRGDGVSRAQGSMVPPPKDFSSAQAKKELTRERMIFSVTYGRANTAMASWKRQLSPEQIEAVVDYVRKTFMKIDDKAIAAEADHGSDQHDHHQATHMEQHSEHHEHQQVAEATPGPDGAKIYHDYCSVCHGEKGDGVSRAQKSLFPSPRDFTSPESLKELTRERMIFSVTYGRANTAMASWKRQLSPEQIEAVVDYVRKNFMRVDEQTQMAAAQEEPDHDDHGEGHQHATPTGDLSVYFAEGFPSQLKGDYDNGELLYKKNCVPCHGETGNGQGPRAYFILPNPRDFQHPAARASLNRPHLFEAIAKGENGSEMPAWEWVLSEQQIADISEYVLQTFIKPEEMFGEPGEAGEKRGETHRHSDGEVHHHH